MANLDEKVSLAAEQILKRPLNDDERYEIYRLADVLGMKDVQSFLHLLLVFKLHESTMKESFAEITALEKKLHDTLESSVGRILGEGAAQIGADMGEAITKRAGELMSSVKDFYTLRGYIVATTITGMVATLAYWFGAAGTFQLESLDGFFSGVLLLPAGWWALFSILAYTYFWCFDNWKLVKKSTVHQCLFAFQGLIALILLLSML